VHELSLVASVFEVLEDEARRHGAAKVTRVVLKVGVMSGVVPDLLGSTFDIYKKDTIAGTARLEIVVVPVKLRCPDCGGLAVREDTDFSCAACGSRRVEIVEGRELVVERIQLETDDPEPGPGGPAPT
jgi:hydrogenase nickel incorporation protein HypA/HybF